MRSERVHTVDLTRFFCDARRATRSSAARSSTRTSRTSRPCSRSRSGRTCGKRSSARSAWPRSGYHAGLGDPTSAMEARVRRGRDRGRRGRGVRRRVGQTPTCFGAAARDPDRPCSNPALRHTVTPHAAARRATLPNSPCRPLERRPSVVRRSARARARRRSRSSATATSGTGAPRWTSWPRPRAGAGCRSRTRAARCRRRCATCPSRGGPRARAGSTRCSRGSREHPEVSTVFVAGLTGGLGRRAAGGSQPVRDVRRAATPTRGVRCRRRCRGSS